MTGYAHPDALVDATWLDKHLGDTGVAVVEVDEDTTAYDREHIPGAIGLDWRMDLHDRPRREFVSSAALARILGDRGISHDQTIVLYGGNNNWFAAYAYWLFRYRGVERVALMDGGRKKWELDGRTMTTERPTPPPATFTIGAARPELRVHRDEVLQRVLGNEGRFVDVRSPEEFRGELLAPAHLPQEQAQVPGHIPGAANIPWARSANDDGTFKSVDELAALYGGAGLTPQDDVVAYCRIGERSAHTWFVLTELLGFPRVRNYDGSWTEYGSLVDVPVEI